MGAEPGELVAQWVGVSTDVTDDGDPHPVRWPFAEPAGEELQGAERRDPSGAHRLYAFRSSVMQTDRSTPVTIAMSTLLSAVYADANRVLKQSVAGIFLVMLTLIRPGLRI